MDAGGGYRVAAEAGVEGGMQENEHVFVSRRMLGMERELSQDPVIGLYLVPYEALVTSEAPTTAPTSLTYLLGL